MHILHIYKTYFSESMGGVEQFIRQLGLRHAAMGHKVSVLTLARGISRPEAREVEGGIRLLRFPLDVEIASNGISLSAFRHMRAVAGEADVLHYHFPWPTGDALHQCAPKGIPALVTYHSDIVRQKMLKRVYAPLMRRFLGQMRLLVATSPAYAATSPVLRRYGGKTRVIPIGIDEACYPQPDAALLDIWRERLGQGFFLFVGMLRYYKGLNYLVEAALETGLPVVIAGSGPLEAELKAQAGGAANIHFIGQVEERDKMALLHLCRAFAFPSHQRSEAFGISLVEALMCGKPLISCEIGTGTSYVNLADATGLVIPPQDSGALAAAMRKLAADDALCATLGAAARQRFEALFTAERMAAAYMGLYEELTAQ